MASSRSDFKLEAAGEQAHPVVLDQVFFSLHADKFKQFNSMLDASPSRTYAYLVRTGVLAPWHPGTPAQLELARAASPPTSWTISAAGKAVTMKGSGSRP